MIKINLLFGDEGQALFLILNSNEEVLRLLTLAIERVTKKRLGTQVSFALDVAASSSLKMW